MTDWIDRRTFLSAIGAAGGVSRIHSVGAAAESSQLRASALPVDDEYDATYRRRHWSTQHNTYFEPELNANHQTWTNLRANSSSQIELIDVEWQEFGNPARDPVRDACWRYSFRVSSIAAFLIRNDPDIYEQYDEWRFAGEETASNIPNKLDVRTLIDVRAPKLWDSIRQGLRRCDDPGDDLSNCLNEDQLRRFGRADHIAIAPRHGYSQFQLVSGNQFRADIAQAAQSGEREEREYARQFLDAMASQPVYGSGQYVPNYSDIKEDWRGDPESGSQDVEYGVGAFNIGRTLGGIAADVSAETSGSSLARGASTVLGRLNLFLSIYSLGTNAYTLYEAPEPAGTAHYRGFEFEYPPPEADDENGPVGGHSVVFDVYVTPGKTTFFKAQSKNWQTNEHYDLEPDTRNDEGVINDIEWAVKIEAPDGPEVSDVEKYQSVWLKNAHPTHNQRMGPSPGINRSVETAQVGVPITFDAFDTALHSTDDVTYEWLVELPVEGNNQSGHASPNETGTYTVDEGAGSQFTTTLTEATDHIVTLTATEHRDDGDPVVKKTYEWVEVSPAPQNAVVEEPSSFVAEVDETVTFDGSFEYDGADDTVTEYWRFPRAASSEYPGGIDIPGSIETGEPTESDTVWLEGPSPSFQFTVTGTWEVAYVVQDEDGKTAMDFVTVYVVETQEALDAAMSDRVHAELSLTSETPARLGDTARLNASDGSYAEGELVRLGYDWDLEGTGAFRDLGEIAEDAGRSNVSGALSEGTVEMPRRGTFQEEGTRDVGVMVYAWDPNAAEWENPLKANVDRVQFDVVPPEEYEARVTRIANPPISPGSGAPPETFEMFTAKFSEFTDHAVEFRWRFSGDGEEWDRVTETVGPVAHQYPDTGEYTVRLEVEYDNGHVSTDETTVWI
jgi:hypothetical protein